jgi:endonuclease YncB( thermonuclease family)
MRLPIFRLLALLLALAAAPAALAANLKGFVTGVTDGDTITVRDSRKQQHKVRMAGVDAPERGQPYGEQALQRTRALLLNRPVNVFWFKQEAGGRKVGVVYVSLPARENCEAPCQLNVGLTLVEEGLAWQNRADQGKTVAIPHAEYKQQELAARTARIGLWADDAPVAPWIWRTGAQAPK